MRKSDRSQQTLETDVEPSLLGPVPPTFALHERRSDFSRQVPPPLFGRYIVLEQLGAGGMGVVYAAYDPELDRKVALKLVKADTGTKEARARLLREAQAMARLTHPNVATVFDVGAVEGEIFIAMEFVEGVTLRTWLAEQSHSWREIIALFVDAGRGVAAAHAAGLIHRDLKPDNVMLDSDGRVRVMDFGLAHIDVLEPPSLSTTREVSPTGDDGLLKSQLTRTGALLGTPAYMAPEQWEQGRTSAQTDQFSYCVALWEALYGARPFRGDTVPSLMYAVTTGSIAEPADANQVPKWLRHALERGLSLRPTARWSSMDELLQELGRDRQGRYRRWTAGVLGVAAAVAASVSVTQVLEERLRAATERQRAEDAELAAAHARKAAEREAFERAALADAARHAEVLELAVTPGRQQDALVLGIEVLRPFGLELGDAPTAVMEGISRALSAVHPVWTSDTGDDIRGVASSRESGRVATLGTHVIRLWSAADGEALGILDGATTARTIRFSPNGDLLGVEGETCELRGVDDPTLRHDLDRCRSLRFSRSRGVVFAVLIEGSDFVQGTSSVAVRAWDTRSGDVLWTRPYTQRTISLMLRPGEGQLVVHTFDGRSERIDLLAEETGELERSFALPVPATLRGDDSNAFATATSDGERVASYLSKVNWGRDSDANHDGQLRILNLADGQLLDTGARPVAGLISAFSFSSDDTKILLRAGLHDFARYIVDARNGDIIQHDRGSPRARIVGDTLITVDYEPALTLVPLDTARGDDIARTPMANDERISTYFEEDDSLLLHSRSDLSRWRLGDALMLERWSPPEGEQVAAIGNRHTVTIGTDKNIHVYGENGEALGATRGLPRGGTITGISPMRLPGPPIDGRGGWLVAKYHAPDGQGTHHYYFDAKLGRVTMETGQVITAYHPYLPLFVEDGETGSVLVDARGDDRRGCALITPNGDPSSASARQLVFSADGGLVAELTPCSGTIWETQSCAHVRTFADATCATIPRLGYPHLLRRFLGIERLLLPGSDVSDARTGEVLVDLTAACLPDPPMLALSSPSGERMLTTCQRGEATLWDVDENEAVTDLEVSALSNAMFSSSGRRIAYHSARGDIRVFDASSGDELVQIRPRSRLWGPLRAAFTADENALRVIDTDGSVVTYPASRAALLEAACRALAGTDRAAEVAAGCEDLDLPVR